MQLTREQAEKLQPIIARQLQFLGKLCKRLDALRVDPTCEVYRATHAAFNGVHQLSVELHYQTCEHGVGRTATHP